MRKQQRLDFRRPRWALLIAAVLYLFGAAAEPLVHAYAGEGPVTPREAPAGGAADPPSAPTEAPHDEADCLFCVMVSSVAIPAAGSAPHPPTPGEHLPDAAYRGRPAPQTFLVPAPRGPPLV